MTAKTVEQSFKATLAKSFYNYVKTTELDDSFYASVNYIPESEYDLYAPITGADSDSDAEFFGGSNAFDYDENDKTFYAQGAISLHKVYPGGVSRVVRRQDWVKNTIYPCWPESDSHVLVKEYVSGYARLNVYRCLFSPATESSYSPTGTSSSEIYLPDGYVWKYLYTISNSEAQRFLTNEWMPVPEKVTSTDASTLHTTTNKYRQYVVQANAQPNEVYGFNIVDSDAAQLALTTDIHVGAISYSGVEPTQPFKATLKYDSTKNRVYAELDQKGVGYYGQIRFVNEADSDTSIAFLEGSNLTGMGHGSDAASEMFANNILMVARNIPDGDNNRVINENNFNMINLVKNPIDAMTNKIAQKDFYVACKSMTMTSAPTFVTGDIIQPFPSDDGRRGIVTSVKGSTVYYMNYKIGKESDTFEAGEQVSDATTAKISTISGVTGREAIFDTGDLIMVDKKPTLLVRSLDQIESLIFVLSF